MKTIITRIKRLALALCFVTPLVSWAAEITGYEDFGDVAGVQLWRTAATDSGIQDFAYAKFAAVAAGGTVGDTYTQNTSEATHWRRWASKYQSSSNSYYTAPGLVLVYDQAGLMATPSKGATFGPVSFGGLWVKELGANDTPYGLTDEASKGRATEFGATGYATLFKFEKSFTINRGAASTFYGTATVNITGDAVFTASTGYATVVDADATLKLTGDSTAAMSVGTGLTVNGTLDLSATTHPTISGNVTLAGTIVLPEGTEVSQDNPFTVCSGTLSAANAYVKIGNAEAVEKLIAVSGGAITGFSDPAYEFTENYPTVVPAGQVVTFIGGETAESATVASGVTVNGTLKTRGYISLSGLTTAKESMLEVVDGTATVTASAKQALVGDIKIDAGATMVNAFTEDALNHGWGVYVHVYGTLDMRSTRWTVGGNARIYLYEGGLITGAGQGSNGAIDIISANVRVIASGDSTISANMRVRAENIPFEATEGKTLTISGLINDGVSYSQPGSITKQNSGTLVLTTAPTFTKALKLEAGTLELGGTAASASVTVAASAATVAASSGSTLTGELIFVSHIPSAANKALIASEAFDGAVVLTGTIASAADITGLGAEVTLRDFTGFLNKSASTSGIKVNVEGTFTQSNGWSYDSDRIYLAEIKGNGTMTQSGSQAQLYEVGSIANFTGTFNLTNARIKSNNNAVLDKAQKIATLTVAKTLTVNGGSLTGNLAANDIAVTVDGTPAVGDVLVPVTGTVSVSGTVTVNGDEVEVECVSGEGVKFAGYPTVTVSITVPNVANATVAVSDGTTTYTPTPEGGTTYSVPAGSTITVTYTSDGYEVTGGTFEFTASEGYTVDTTEVVTKQYVASITVGETTTKYTTLQAAIDAVAQNKDIVLLANEADGATVAREATFNVVPGEYTHGDIAAGGDYILTTTASEGKTRYSVSAALMAVTINDVRTLYPATMDGYTAAIEAANAGPIGTTLKVLYGDYTAYVEYLPMFDLDTDTRVFTKVADPVAAVYNGKFQQQVYRTLAEAVAAAEAGQTVKLLSNISVTSMQVVDKTVTLDLNGFAITEGTWTDAAITAGDDAILCVVHGGSLTVNDSSVGKTGAITADGVKATSAIKMTKLGDTDDTNKAILVVNAGTLTGYYYAVTGNGSTGRGNTEVTINGGTLRGTCVDDSVAIFNPQAGTLTIAGGYLEGAMGVYVKSGTATVTVTAGTIKGVGTKTAYKASKNGFNNTGDAFVVDNVGYPGGAPAPSILGGTFVSENASAIASYSAYGYARITKFAAASLKTSGITEAVASSADVFDDYSAGINPTDPTSKQEVTPTTEEIEAAGSAEAAAIAKATVKVPDGVSGVDAATYKTYFTYSATPTATADTYAVAITGFADEVTETADGNALAALEAATAGDTLSAEVVVKPGLYYGTAAGADVTKLKAPAGTLNTTGKLDLSGVTKPSTGEAFFIKIKVGTTAFTAEE